MYLPSKYLKYPYSISGFVNPPCTFSQDASVSDDSVALYSDDETDKWTFIARSAFLFDTSSIGGGFQVDSADFKVYVSNSASDDFSMSIALTSSNPTSNTAIANGDYQNFGTTRYANDLAISSMTIPAYNTMSLNSSGKSAVDMEGITKLGLRSAPDIDDTPPTWSASQNSRITTLFADNGSNEPTLDVTYSTPTGFKNLLLMGVG